MKKILFILMFAAFGFTSNAQNIGATFISAYGSSVDTVNNTDIVYLSLPSTVKVAGFFKSAMFVFKTEKISGNGSSATAIVQASANGVDFADIGSAFTLANVSEVQTKSFIFSNIGAKSYRIKIVGSGTMSYKVYGSCFLTN